MKYLFLSFAENLDKDAKNKIDFYNISLKKQYELIKKRIPNDKKIEDDFKQFIEICFPTGLQKKYYLSCPNFLREKRRDSKGNLFLNNLVIRPEKTLQMNNYLPNNQNIILIGDILESGPRLKMFTIKGIQLIDDSMSSPFDIVITDCAACNCFVRNEWSINYVDYEDTYFTPDNILNIITNCYTVNDPVKVKETYNLWNEYFEFRDYYLKEQTQKNLKADKCEYIDSYAINRKEYKKNSLEYDDHILDNHDDFKHGDMIVVDAKVGEADAFPLIRVDFIRNKKEFLSNVVIKGNKQINEEERKIRSLANENVIITSSKPNDDLGDLIRNGYELGDKFKIIKFEIEPTKHLEELEKEYKALITNETYAAEMQYKNKVTKEVARYLKEYKREKKTINESLINDYIQNLNNNLLIEIEKNDDKEILEIIDDKEILEIIKEEKRKIKKDNKQENNESKEDYENRLEELYNSIDIRSFYESRNNKLILEYENKLDLELKNELENVKEDKERELTNKYSEDIKNESLNIKKKYENELIDKKNLIIDSETKICFSVYFKPNDNREITKKQIEQIAKCEYIVYDFRAEKAKLKRQEMALDNFYSGNVKNPYLSTYLFMPDKLKPVISSHTEWQWYLESLNEKQKEAVRKTVASNGIFLLQGPPGTGKTQVIAEIVAHLVKDGKKVLISSETHKAIDNVFERLPKIAEIIPLRLIPSKNNKESEYTPKYLVDNFYLNIRTNMKNIVTKYENFKKNKETFEENFNELKLLNNKIEKLDKTYELAQKQIDALDNKAKEKNRIISEKNDIEDSVRSSIDKLRRTKRHVEKTNLSLDDDICKDIIANYIKNLDNLFETAKFNKNGGLEKLVKLVNSVKNPEIEEAIRKLNLQSLEAIIQAELNEILNKMNSLKDELGDPLPGKEDEVKALRKQYIDKKNEQKERGLETNQKSILENLFNYDFVIKNIDFLPQIINSKKSSLIILKNDVIAEIDELTRKEEDKIDNIEKEIYAINKENKNINLEIAEIEESNEIQEIQKNKRKLETKIEKFFKDFAIVEPYKNVQEALDIIKNTFEDLEVNYAKREAENKEKIPMYEKISNYLSQTDVIEDDRKLYTKDLFESANVFGITCTSNDRFTNENNSELGDFNIDDIDIKTVGIDVVIIDEVSKSSFIDLLIPILYGKTVILVGDHRQLPPMYEFAKLRDEEFVNLDENIINPDINRKFTKMYEECFFKTLFEKIPDDYKTMLVQQYRCHEHIMNVFNHFYQGELKLGFVGQNNQKKHNIELFSNGRKIIQADKHIYFIDCKQFETRDQDSTSIYNMGEAKVVVELLKKLKIYFSNNSAIEPLSVGVISTYGDQAKKIKELMKTEKINVNDFVKGQEKLIVSTVDDFQGDERDIIILSTVRNPQEPFKSNPGFILAYQRINVALSRARRLLIIVGNRNYLEQKGVIDLPDVYGRPGFDCHNFRVYEEILNTIEIYGKVLEDIDIISPKEGRINA